MKIPKMKKKTIYMLSNDNKAIIREIFLQYMNFSQTTLIFVTQVVLAKYSLTYIFEHIILLVKFHLSPTNLCEFYLNLLRHIWILTNKKNMLDNVLLASFLLHSYSLEQMYLTSGVFCNQEVSHMYSLYLPLYLENSIMWILSTLFF